MSVSGAMNVSGPVSAVDATGDVATLAGDAGAGVRGHGADTGVLGEGKTGIQGNGSEFGIVGSGPVGAFGQGIGSAGAGILGQGDHAGVVGQGPAFGLIGETLGSGVGIKAIDRALVDPSNNIGAAVDAFSTNMGVRAWGQSIGMEGVSDVAGVVGAHRDPETPIVAPTVPAPELHFPNNHFGVIGNCIRYSSGKCMGVYGYGEAPESAHGVVGVTNFPGVDGAGTIGLTNEGGQGVRGGSTTANGIGIVGYNDAGGIAIQSQGELRVFGDVTYSGSLVHSSSRRFKNNIETLNGALDKVERLRGVTFDWTETGKHDVGLIAEEVAEVVPEVVAYERNGPDARGVDYAQLTAVLVEAIKEQRAEIEQLRARLEQLSAK
jgi:hypothetical protein